MVPDTTEYTPPPEEGIQWRNSPAADVQSLAISGNATRRLPIGNHDTSDGTTVPVSRNFDRFRDMCMNILQSNYMTHAAAVHNSGNGSKNAGNLFRKELGTLPHEAKIKKEGNRQAKNSPYGSSQMDSVKKAIVERELYKKAHDSKDKFKKQDKSCRSGNDTRAEADRGLPALSAKAGKKKRKARNDQYNRCSKKLSRVVSPMRLECIVGH
nr:hypothetical protein [Tanacetum cinerariifolium]